MVFLCMSCTLTFNRSVSHFVLIPHPRLRCIVMSLLTKLFLPLRFNLHCLYVSCNHYYWSRYQHCIIHSRIKLVERKPAFILRSSLVVTRPLMYEDQVIFQKNLDTQLKIARVIVEKLSVTCHLLIEEIPLVGSGFLSLNNATFVVESFITVDIPFRAPITMRYWN